MYERKGQKEEHDGLAQALGLMGLSQEEAWVAWRAQQHG
jgi:hypothetical protein